ncbi:MAG: CoA ester lyase [Thermaerobacter sp.]|nr:CoA ester lyase [Thermaerobacter sp.]
MRSWLFSPADVPQRCLKALDTAADQVIWDLEDGVAAGRKEMARAQLAGLAEQTASARMPWIRINGPDTVWAADDLQAALKACSGRPPRIAVPKVDARVVAWLQQQGPAQSVQWLLIVESARGLWDLMHLDTAWLPGMSVRIAFGALDYQADVGGDIGLDEQELLMPRSEIVLACRSLGWMAPIDAVYPRFDDEDGLSRAAQTARRLGYAGKMVIHPKQIGPVHQAFAPSDAELAWARGVLAAGTGAGAVQVAGQMIDRPLLERARQILAAAEGD